MHVQYRHAKRILSLLMILRELQQVSNAYQNLCNMTSLLPRHFDKIRDYCKDYLHNSKVKGSTTADLTDILKSNSGIDQNIIERFAQLRVACKKKLFEELSSVCHLGISRYQRSGAKIWQLSISPLTNLPEDFIGRIILSQQTVRKMAKLLTILRSQHLISCNHTWSCQMQLQINQLQRQNQGQPGRERHMRHVVKRQKNKKEILSYKPLKKNYSLTNLNFKQ